MDKNLEILLQQADQLRDGLHQMHQQQKQMGFNSVGIQESAKTIQKCLKKVGNNRLAALSNRDKRKVYEEMEDAVDRLMEFISE